MKATCPNCQTSYRVSDDKVPDQGAQIKCPKCQSTFVVRQGEKSAEEPPVAEPQAGKPDPLPPPPATAQAAASSAPAEQPPANQVPAAQPAAPSAEAAQASNPHDQATPLIDLINEQKTAEATEQTAQPQPEPAQADGTSQTPNLDSLDGEAFISTANTQARERPKARGVSAIRAQTGSGRETLEGYRIRTARGLTYDFPSLKAMMRWLAEREDVSGCQVAPPGKEWESLATFLAEQDKRPGFKLGGIPEALAEPPADEPAPRRVADKIGGDQEDPSKPIEVGRIQPVVPPNMPLPAGARSQAFDLPSGPRAGIVVWASLVVCVLALALGAAATLTRYGIVDLSAVPPVAQVGIEFPNISESVDQKAGEAPRVPAVGDPEIAYQDALGAGRRALRAKQFSKAALEFNRALGIHPGAVDALEGMAQAYAGLGDLPRARETRKQARKIKGR